MVLVVAIASSIVFGMVRVWSVLRVT